MSSIYIHIPFCHHKCIYCDFYSIACHNKEEIVPSYITALKKEIVMKKDLLPFPINTIYFGGGSPSLLPINQIQEILLSLKDNYNTSQIEEITLEANPEDLSLDYLKRLKDIGINRLSIGIQSFDDKELRLLNRSHTSQQARTSIENAKSVGFNNISIDLIYNLPFSTIDSYKNNLNIFLSYSLPHISCYSLTREENTMLDKLIKQNKLSIPNEEEQLKQMDCTIKTLEENNYIHYETSSYCKQGFYSRHNAAYWTNKDYLGFGAAAHSYIKDRRFWNDSNIDSYIKKVNNGVVFDNDNMEELSYKDKYNEYVMLSSRLGSGFNLPYVEKTFPSYYNHFTKGITSLQRQGLLSPSFTPTLLGFHLQNEITLTLMV
jgi:oxygen-independent coproporphyrinogen III oxidase